jgi:DNA-binding MarR family transcriptional regulator
MTLLAAMVIFCTGALSGGLAVRLYDAHHRAHMVRATISSGPGWNQRADLLKRLEKHIALTPAQHEQIEQILSDSQNRMKAIWSRVSPEAREEYKTTNQRIIAILTEDQRKVFEELTRTRAVRKDHPAENKDGKASFHTNASLTPMTPVKP